MLPISLASFCILLKVNEDEYGIAKKMMKRLGKMSRRSNSVRQETDGGEGMVENCTVNYRNSSQVRYIGISTMLCFGWALPNIFFRFWQIKVPWSAWVDWLSPWDPCSSWDLSNISSTPEFWSDSQVECWDLPCVLSSGSTGVINSELFWRNGLKFEHKSIYVVGWRK